MFADSWFAAGVVDAEAAAAFEEYARRDPSRSVRHWRWAAFQDHLEEHTPLPVDRCRELFELGEREADRNLGTAMMCAAVYQRHCPADVKQRATDAVLQRAVRQSPRGRTEGG
ncbi:MAG: hypothetical protein U0791_10325 [Gemmataceae bacterium]